MTVRQFSVEEVHQTYEVRGCCIGNCPHDPARSPKIDALCAIHAECGRDLARRLPQHPATNDRFHTEFFRLCGNDSSGGWSCSSWTSATRSRNALIRSTSPSRAAVHSIMVSLLSAQNLGAVAALRRSYPVQQDQYLAAGAAAGGLRLRRQADPGAGAWLYRAHFSSPTRPNWAGICAAAVRRSGGLRSFRYPPLRAATAGRIVLADLADGAAMD